MLFVIICLVCPVLSVMSSWKAVSPASFVSSSSLHAFNCFTLSLLIQEVSRLFPFAPCFPFFVGEEEHYFLLVSSFLVTRWWENHVLNVDLSCLGCTDSFWQFSTKPWVSRDWMLPQDLTLDKRHPGNRANDVSGEPFVAVVVSFCSFPFFLFFFFSINRRRRRRRSWNLIVSCFALSCVLRSMYKT